MPALFYVYQPQQAQSQHSKELDCGLRANLFELEAALLLELVEPVAFGIRGIWDAGRPFDEFGLAIWTSLRY